MKAEVKFEKENKQKPFLYDFDCFIFYKTA